MLRKIAHRLCPLAFVRSEKVVFAGGHPAIDAEADHHPGSCSFPGLQLHRTGQPGDVPGAPATGKGRPAQDSDGRVSTENVFYYCVPIPMLSHQ